MTHEDDVREAVAEQKRNATPLTEEDTALAQWAQKLEETSRAIITHIIVDARKVLK